MNGPNIAAYSEDFLGISDPNDGGLHSKYAIDSGLTTVILGQLHINASEDEPIRFDTIHYNNTLLIDKGTNKADLATWQKILASIKANFGSRSSITKIYASIGGQHPPIKDFQNISFVYNNNNKSFDRTMLKKNLNTLKVALPAIDGIDMDNEEWYDIESFNEFCRMVHEELHWDITFSVFGKWHDNDDFWQKAIRYLWQIKCPLKWINLQMYYEGGTDPPHEWAKNIKDMLKDFPTDNFFLPGFHARYGLNNVYTHDCPSVVKDKLVSYWANEKDPKDAKACIGGAFIWNLDYAYRARIDPYACPGVEMADITNYTSAIAEAMQN